MSTKGSAAFNGSALYTVPNRAPKLLRKFYAESVTTRLMNRDYEGDLKNKGDRVTIPQRPVISIGEWTTATTFTYPELTPPAAKELIIDQAPYYEFSINNIDKTQAYLKGFDGDWLDEATNQLRIKQEDTVLNAAPALVDASNTGNTAGGGVAGVGTGGVLKLGTITSPVFLTYQKSYKDTTNGRNYINVVKYITDCLTALRKNNIDLTLPRWIIADSMVGNLLANSELSSALVTGDSVGVIRNGPDRLGKIQSADLFQTTRFNQLAGGENGEIPVFPLLFGVDAAWSIAAQVKDVWSDQLQTKSAIGFRGTLIYGWAVTIPTAIGCGYISFDGGI